MFYLIVEVSYEQLLRLVSDVKTEIVLGKYTKTFTGSTFWTEARTGSLKIVVPMVNNVKKGHFDFLSMDYQEDVMKMILSITAFAQMVAYSIYPEGNILFRSRHEVELIMTILRSCSKTYKDSLYNKGITFTDFFSHLLFVHVSPFEFF